MVKQLSDIAVYYIIKSVLLFFFNSCIQFNNFQKNKLFNRYYFLDILAIFYKAVQSVT